MIYLQLFLQFLKIGAISFGGGYAMIPLIRETVVDCGWLTDEAFLNFVAVSESTPGPIAINMATFVGSSQGGVLGALCATFGVVLPSFVIILLIAALLRNLIKYAGVQAFLSGLRPVVAGLITATGATMLLSQLTGIGKIGDDFAFSWRSAAIFAAVAVAAFVYRRVRKKRVSPILLILLSAGLGMALYSIPV